VTIVAEYATSFSPIVSILATGARPRQPPERRGEVRAAPTSRLARLSDNVAWMIDRILPAYESAEQLEAQLGDPLDDRTRFSFRRVMELDEREEFPASLIDHVREFPMDEFIILNEQGGSFDSLEASSARHRTVARRDLTTAIALGATYLAFLPVWAGGSTAQRERFARAYRERRMAALALTERDRGADLVATQTVAVKTSDGWSLSGEKWLINNATRGELIVVLARTDVPGKRPAVSLFLVDKSAALPATIEHLPKVRLHGTRGMDVAGIRFADTRVPHDALIGELGTGIELVLRGFVCSRSAIAARAVAATDTSLRMTIDFARSRQLYGNNVLAIPHANQQLAGCFAELLLCDALTIASARSLHVAPAQAALVASITKYLVPTSCEKIISECAAILGARFFLREGHWHGMFQKVQRDTQLLGLFDGSTIINLSSIASQLGPLIAERQTARSDDTAACIAAVCGLAAPLPPLRFERVELLARGRNDIMTCLDDLPAQIEATRAHGASERTVDELVRMARGVSAETERLEGHLHAGFRAGWATKPRSHEAIELARRYCVLNGIALAMHVWVHSRRDLGGAFARGEWLGVAGNRMLSTLRGVEAPGSRADIAAVGSEMLRLFAANRAFSIVPIRLGGHFDRGADSRATM
jgi:alkylation response protein AidB-like acyl-CoA dehydrogenase